MTAIMQWQVGEVLPPQTLPAITRTMLALFAGGSGDHNPLHVDFDFARHEAGMDDVIGHGMFGMALLGRYLTELSDQRAIRDLSVRFLGMTRVGDRLNCSAVVERIDSDGVALSLLVTRQDGDSIMTGSARLGRTS